MQRTRLLALALAGGLVPLAAAANVRQTALTFCCAPDNDLYLALAAGGTRYPRAATPAAAVTRARPGSAVLLLADGYPEARRQVGADVLDAATRKQLRLYLEYPAGLPGLELGAPRTAVWERAVVTGDDFGSALPRMRILAIHQAHVLECSHPDPLLVLARVAGYDTAVYGLPKASYPILFEVPERRWFVATTRLSGFVTGRFAPADDWRTVWQTLLRRLDPDHAPHALRWRPVVQTAFAPGDKLPRHYEREALAAAAGWLRRSGLLVPPSRQSAIHAALSANVETLPPPDEPTGTGDGSCGILEGFASGIRPDGTQWQRTPLRADCQAESAMVWALEARLRRQRSGVDIARNLLDYVYRTSDLCAGPRADPQHTAFGMIGWGSTSPLWLRANYGDDNARTLLATLLAAVALGTDRWDEPMAKALLANFRTTGRAGFRGDRLDLPDLEQRGWRAYHDAAPLNYSPHFESYLWACYLWAYRQTGFRPMFERTTNAIALTMQAYPGGWRWGDGMERARMLLCLAWLVRLEDSPQHRQWLRQIASDLLERQSPTGAIHDWLAGAGGGHYQIPRSNEAYGTAETPLIQQNGDPASDQLYTTGFALFALHEAAAATGDAALKQAEDRLAEYLCRIQTRSRRFPWLNGWWFRAFDDRRWECWASSADIGWGAWCLEAGWAQAWAAATLGLRLEGTTFWEFTASSRVHTAFREWQPRLLPADAR